MSAAPSKQLVIDAWQAFATRDADRIRDVFTSDAEWLAPAGNATARALDGTHHLVGRDRIVRFLADEFGTVFVDDVSIEFGGFHADGDTVVVEMRLRATLAHGGRYDNEYCLVFELEQGLIKRVREYMDTRRGAAWFRSPSTSDRPGAPLSAEVVGGSGDAP
ncbi:ketosteroid isomerase [Actinoplanes sp. ATCC 53533]|uniref:nuclear transport factor 2 family protein n=1 Tax=Actinoplanes sp. ATCC 53533 TaxID=1288362 RepID=UPI000F7AF7CD|nr:nuclear transport factor 2 family protein [Actinoplanes sp. ATCC 53533]RSM51922.1 ketosteroid isomerase [Actinoplanes sp. ATCC 53533]